MFLGFLTLKWTERKPTEVYELQISSRQVVSISQRHWDCGAFRSPQWNHSRPRLPLLDGVHGCIYDICQKQRNHRERFCRPIPYLGRLSRHENIIKHPYFGARPVHNFTLPCFGGSPLMLMKAHLLQRVLLQVMFTWGTKPLEVSIPDLAVDPASSDGLRYHQIPAKAIGILPFEVFGGYVISKSTLQSWPSNKSQDRLCPKIIAGARNSLVNLSWIAEVSPSLIKSLLTWRQTLKSS